MVGWCHHCFVDLINLSFFHIFSQLLSILWTPPSSSIIHAFLASLLSTLRRHIAQIRMLPLQQCLTLLSTIDNQTGAGCPTLQICPLPFELLLIMLILPLVSFVYYPQSKIGS